MDELNKKAGEQSILLKTKQDEADAALQEITISMQVLYVIISKLKKKHQKTTENKKLYGCLCLVLFSRSTRPNDFTRSCLEKNMSLGA